MKDNRGFTLIELMIAAGIFAVILLGAAGALTQISRLYYKGIISSRTQNVSRTVIDEISRSIQFTPDDPVFVTDPMGDPNKAALCINKDRYNINLNVQLNDTDYVLLKDKTPSTGCDLSAPDPANGEELLENRMRLTEFVVTGPVGNNLWDIGIKVVYGDDELLNNVGEPNVSCRGSATGSQWCSVSGLKTKVYKRVQAQ